MTITDIIGDINSGLTARDLASVFRLTGDGYPGASEQCRLIEGEEESVRS